ncbi:MAG: tetratricopeptide repeat protein [Magnetococcales bacterium]|nr:tetratricopeptide repeat protein [Magnetococcales bacterium]
MNPQQPITLEQALQWAIDHHQAGRFQEAESLYRQILNADPNQPDALHLLGVMAHQAGQAQDAVPMIQKALALRPRQAEMHNNLGNALRDLGQIEAAIQSCRRAIALKRRFPEAYNNLGTALLQQGAFQQAVKQFRKALSQQPNYVAAHKNLGVALRSLGNTDAAIASLRRALNLKPHDPEIHINLGGLLTETARFDEAITHLNRAAELAPDHPENLHNLALYHQRQGCLAEAISHYHKVLAHRPKDAEAHFNLAQALDKNRQLEEAIQSYRKALTLDPGHLGSHDNLAIVLSRTGMLDEALIHAEQAAAGGQPAMIKNWLNLQLAHPETTYDALFKACVNWRDAAVDPACKPLIRQMPKETPPRLKIGYLSSDFRDHPVGRNVAPLLMNHDHDRFEITLYAEPPREDHWTERFQKAADRWQNIAGLSDLQVARRIRKDGIHIMVYLAGLFDTNRVQVAAHRPAPIQVSYHSGTTTALEQMDYWFTDEALHPPEATSEQFSETLFRLPCFYAYPEPEQAPPIEPLPARQNGYVTFASLNNLSKINNKVIQLWAAILHGAADARLMLKYRDHLDIPYLKQCIIERFQKHDIDTERLILISALEDHPSHMARYHQADIALDPFPFTGATTTFQALWMGVPVITLLGKNFIGRMAGDILIHTGLKELATESSDAYCKQALALAGDLDRLERLRHTLRDQLLASPICHENQYAQSVESSYQTMWRQRMKART